MRVATLLGAALLLLSSTRGAASGDESVQGAGMTVALSGNTITLSRSVEGGSADASALILKVAGLTELDAFSQPVGNNAIEAHSLSAEDILGLDFVISGPEDVKYQNMSASSTNLTAVVFSTEDGETTLSIQTLLFLGSGNITAGGETTEVVEGSLKLSFNVTNWPFCTRTDSTDSPEQADSLAYCLDRDSELETGSFLDLSFEVSGPAQRQTNPVAPQKGGFSEKREEKRQDEEAQASEGAGDRRGRRGLAGFRRRLAGPDDDTPDDDTISDDGSDDDDDDDAYASPTDDDGFYEYDDYYAAEDGAVHGNEPGQEGAGQDGKSERKLAHGYSMSLANASTQSLLDVSGYYWCSQHNAWYPVEGGVGYTVASDNSTAIFTVRMHAASGTLLYDPTMTVAAQSSVTANTEATSAAFALATSWASAAMALLATMVVAAGGQFYA